MVTVSQYLSGIMHLGSQFLQVPTMACMLLLMLAMVFCLGSLVAECFAERRHFKINHREAIIKIHDADYDDIGDVVSSCALLKSQKQSLINVARNMGLPDEELFALAQVELSRSDDHYRHRINFTDTVAKVAPMLGLMGTLIPLGPGIVAMGKGDVSTLSQSLLIAFDTTVMGLVAAIVALIISRVRKTWYGEYAAMMRSLMSCIVEEAAVARDAGIQLPYGYVGPNPECDILEEMVKKHEADREREAIAAFDSSPSPRKRRHLVKRDISGVPEVSAVSVCKEKVAKDETA